MKKNIPIFIIIIISLFTSCKKDIKNSADRFKSGVFKIPAGKGFPKSTIIRKGNIQIEEYTKEVSIFKDGKTTLQSEKHRDTFYIKWLNNFKYQLKKKVLNTPEDRDITHVQLTKVTDSSYNFTATIGFSDFPIKGTVYKVK